jgi:hypothetical protein
MRSRGSGSMPQRSSSSEWRISGIRSWIAATSLGPVVAMVKILGPTGPLPTAPRSHVLEDVDYDQAAFGVASIHLWRSSRPPSSSGRQLTARRGYRARHAPSGASNWPRPRPAPRQACVRREAQPRCHPPDTYSVPSYSRSGIENTEADVVAIGYEPEDDLARALGV